MGSEIPTHPASQPPMPAVAASLSRYDHNKLASFIEVAISLLDTLDGDPDIEDDDPDSENENRHAEVSYAEWHTRGRHKLAKGEFEAADHNEDDEDDDPDTGAEDAPEGFDPEEDTGQDDFGEPTEDLEIKQMADDVPCIPVFTLDHNIFNDQRQLLGHTLPKPLPDGTVEPEL